MAQENQIIDLPGSGGKAEIRSFVKNKDRKAVQRVLVGSKEFGENDDTSKIKVPASNLFDSVEVQVRALLISLRDKDNNLFEGDPYDVLLESEYSEDLDAVEAAVQKIFGNGNDKDAAEKK